MLRDGNKFPTLVAVAKATLRNPKASDSDRAGALAVLAVDRDEPVTHAEMTCALTYLFNHARAPRRAWIDRPEQRDTSRVRASTARLLSQR